jgi:hypothetical protein
MAFLLDLMVGIIVKVGVLMVAIGYELNLAIIN